VAYWSYFDPGDFDKILLIIDTIAHHIAKCPQSPLETVCRSFFLGLLESRRLALAVFNVTITDIL
jgi:hypothetical protein